MSENGFYLLPTNTLYKKEDTRQHKNFPASYVRRFYKNLADNVDFYSRITADVDIPRENIQKDILATSEVFKLTLITMSREIRSVKIF